MASVPAARHVLEAVADTFGPLCRFLKVRVVDGGGSQAPLVYHLRHLPGAGQEPGQGPDAEDQPPDHQEPHDQLDPGTETHLRGPCSASGLVIGNT